MNIPEFVLTPVIVGFIGWLVWMTNKLNSLSEDVSEIKGQLRK
jgi:hypothetical protein